MNDFKISLTTVCHLLIISAVGVLVYSNTLTSSFQFDDKLNILDNPYIRDIGNLWPPAGARWFGLLTFSLNYLAGGLNPVGYHLVNICIHILTAASVYLFVLLTLRTPHVRGSGGTVIPEGWFACACALLFVAHPLQTQAVTYIVQRFASLATLLFMLSLDAYILARLTAGKRGADSSPVSLLPHRAAPVLYTAALLFALLSLKTKEIASTLPVAVILYDVLFISGLAQLRAALRKRWRAVAALSGLALVFLVFAINRYGLAALLDKFKATNEISRHDYLVTQFRVVVTYIRLLFVPVNQTVDHHYRVFRSIFAPEVLASLALIVLLLGLAVYLYRVPRERSPYPRIVSFGIFWFFLTLSVESSIIPIIDVMFEHRLYLPSIGAILAVAASAAWALDKVKMGRGLARVTAAGILAAAVVALACTAHVRNRVWKTDLTLWSDAIAKKPDNPRAYNMVGSCYQAAFRIYDAIDYFKKALEVDSSYAEARSNLGNAYIQIGRVDEGLNELMITARNNRFDEIDTGILHYNIAKGLYRKGMTDAAIENLKMAQRLIPNEAEVYFLLGEAYRLKNLPELSSANFKRAHELAPGRY